MAEDDFGVRRQLDYTIDFTTADPIDDADHWDGARGGKYLMDGIGGEMERCRLNNDIPIIRYADILLMRAEALFRLNSGSAEALTLVNQVRTRNGNNPVAAFTRLTEADLLAERGREFAWEGWRRNDLIRFNNLMIRETS
ncbi:MAG: RagB/SusD family nutrient uptake outer membrane protein [Tannerellaceae bacterium]|nr:RagB/SusD family nutrient uptake outer membrane protein [Tannerellaceae bacterium]